MSHDILRDEHESLQRAVQASRKAAQRLPETAFVRDMQKVMDDYRDARKGGLTREQAIPGIEAVLRETGQFRVSKFSATCDLCDDSGWMQKTCWHELRCERQRCHEQHPAHGHTYVVPCACPKGDVKACRNQDTADAMAEAMRGRKPKPRGFSRL